MALLKYDELDAYLCIGALINDKYVITAAVCLTDVSYNLKSVVLGAHELETSPHIVELGIEDKVVHEDFEKGKRLCDQDIALIRLNRTVKYSDYIKPICLPNYDTNLAKPDDVVTISGWGIGVDGTVITTKKVVLRRFIPNAECQLLNSKQGVTITENRICTHTLKDHKAYACLGDAGSPVMFLYANQWYLEAIFSFGPLCGTDFPYVNTNIAKYVKWIQDNIRE
ncbi:hypothetical protein FQR65_LT12600 [Abscondita terminalis]|nr:hypothetical protein FQR65_LT12600 [Abscondita terminalis]